jgi:hypothetical protein
MLGAQSVPRTEFSQIVHDLVGRPTRASLLTPDGQTHRVPLRQVTIERYVHRLRLEGGIPQALLARLDRVSSASPADQAMLYAVARRPAWESEGPRQILARYLEMAPERGGDVLADALDLLNLIESRKPRDLADLLGRMPGWQQALRDQIESGPGQKPFFMEEIRMMHGGGRDQRRGADVTLSAKERDLQFLTRLEKILA